MSTPRRVYLGDKLITYAYQGDNSFYRPFFSFITVLTSVPWELSVTGCGLSSFNTIWRYTPLPPNAVQRWVNVNIPGNIITSASIQWNTTRNRFEFRYTALTSTYVYFTTGYSNSSLDVPLTGWQSWNPAWSPAPTVIYNTQLTLSAIVINNTTGYISFPPLTPSMYYQQGDTFYGYTSSTLFDQVTGIDFRSNVVKSANINMLPYLKKLRYNTTYVLEGVEVKDHDNIEDMVVATTFSTNINAVTGLKVNIQNTPSLTNLLINTELINENNFLINNCPNLTSLDLGSTRNIKNFTANFPKLALLNLNLAPLTSLNLTYINSLSTLSISNNNLSGFEIVDHFLSNRKRITYSSGGEILQNKNFGRTQASTAGMYESISSNNGSIVNGYIYEIDPMYPKYQVPTEIYTTTLPGSSIIVTAPISGTVTTRHPFISGEYFMVPNLLKDNRSVFRNVNDYYILYNSTNDWWTLVGPTSTSNTVWLSTVGGAGDWGNVPSYFWSGPAYSAPGWGGTGAWYQGTRVFSSSMLYLSSMTITQDGVDKLRYNLGPLSALNSNFYWKHLDFSGRGWSNTVNQPISPGVVLISPIHFVGNLHFNPGIGGTVNFINRDGSVETRTCLSSIAIQGGAGYNDQILGILNAPVSATYYRLFNNLPSLKVTSAESFKNFIYGPNQYGLVGYGSLRYVLNFCYPDLTPPYREQTYTIPKSLWHGEFLVGGDSSTPYWYINQNELILISTTYSGDGSGPFFGNENNYNKLQTYSQLMTALSLQFFGPNTNYYTVSAYDPTI